MKTFLREFLKVVLIWCIIMVFPVPVEANFNMSLSELQNKFPDGAYWNHVAQEGHGYTDGGVTAYGPCNNPDGYTWHPCNIHGGIAGVGGYDCNGYNKAIQCHGFALKLAYDAYGQNARNWAQTTIDNVKAGDIIRYTFSGGEHTIFVTGVSGDTITYGECNWDGWCMIRWNKTTTKTALRPVIKYILSAPSELKKDDLEDGQFFDFWGFDDTNISGYPKIWLKSVGFSADSQVNVYVDDNLNQIIYPDTGGFYAFILNTYAFTQSQHKLTVILISNGKTVERTKYVAINNSSSSEFFSFWRIENESVLGGIEKIWLKTANFGADSYVNVYIDDVLLQTLYPDDSGFYSFYLDTTKYTQSRHKLSAHLSGNDKVIKDVIYISISNPDISDVMPTVTITPIPTIIPEPTETPDPTETPVVTIVPNPTVTLEPSEIPEPTDVPNPTKVPTDRWLFDDVQNPEAFYYTPVYWAYDNNITKGVTTVLFKPNDGCSRSQIVTFIWRAEGEPKAENTECKFKDVDDDQFYYKPMLWAVEAGVITGYTDEKFAPDDICTRGQIVTMLWRAMDKPEPVNKEHPFTDVKEEYYYTAMLWAVKNGITKGQTETTFAPDKTVTRGETVTFLYRVYCEIVYPEPEEKMFVQSSTMQEYEGKIYTVLSINVGTNIVKVPGSYLTQLAVYEDYIYYINENIGTGGDPTELYSMNLNSGEKQVFLNNVDPFSRFCIYDDVLYYTAFSDAEGKWCSRSIHLDTQKVEEEKYFFEFGNKDAWIISDGSSEYCSGPEYKSVQALAIQTQKYDEGVVGVYDGMLYYYIDGAIKTSSIYGSKAEVLISSVNDSYSPQVIGHALYYIPYNTTELHRFDLEDKTTKLYDVRVRELKNEINGKLYFTSGVEDSFANYNTSCKELDLETGAVKQVGTWFES